MHQYFQEYFNNLTKDKNYLIESSTKLAEDELNTSHAEGKWSIGQILFHVIKVERITLISLQKYIKELENLEEATTKNVLSSQLLKRAMQSDRKFKAPDIVANVPERVTLSELSDKWNQIRNKLNLILDDFPQSAENKLVFDHPYAGKLNIIQTLDFLVEHLRHHLRQIENIIKNHKDN
jgi:uncharacterized damage-inducible protein DinB